MAHQGRIGFGPRGNCESNVARNAACVRARAELETRENQGCDAEQRAAAPAKQPCERQPNCRAISPGFIEATQQQGEPNMKERKSSAIVEPAASTAFGRKPGTG